MFVHGNYYSRSHKSSIGPSDHTAVDLTNVVNTSWTNIYFIFEHASASSTCSAIITNIINILQQLLLYMRLWNDGPQTDMLQNVAHNIICMCTQTVLDKNASTGAKFIIRRVNTAQAHLTPLHKTIPVAVYLLTCKLWSICVCRNGGKAIQSDVFTLRTVVSCVWVYFVRSHRWWLAIWWLQYSTNNSHTTGWAHFR